MIFTESEKANLARINGNVFVERLILKKNFHKDPFLIHIGHHIHSYHGLSKVLGFFYVYVEEGVYFFFLLLIFYNV